jgi:hypothetical protein
MKGSLNASQDVTARASPRAVLSRLAMVIATLGDDNPLDIRPGLQRAVIRFFDRAFSILRSRPSDRASASISSARLEGERPW